MTKRVGPCVYISDLPRTTTRAAWKWIYRCIRVVTRESEKVMMDTMIYGNGSMSFPFNDDPRHVPIEQVVIKQ